MRALLARAALTVAANAVALVVAAVILDDMTVGPVSLVIAVAIFSAVEVVAHALVSRVLARHLPLLVSGTALVATLLGLVVAVAVTDGMRIRGFGTWILAATIVWVGALVAQLVLPAVARRLVPAEEAVGLDPPRP